METTSTLPIRQTELTPPKGGVTKVPRQAVAAVATLSAAAAQAQGRNRGKNAIAQAVEAEGYSMDAEQVVQGVGGLSALRLVEADIAKQQAKMKELTEASTGTDSSTVAMTGSISMTQISVHLQEDQSQISSIEEQQFSNPQNVILVDSMLGKEFCELDESMSRTR